MQSLLIIALSARMYAEAAAQAGFAVTVIDGFGDQETRAISQDVFTVDINHSGFDAANLLQVVRALPLKKYIGFLYGSGFEAQPTLLADIALLLPIIGNSPEVVAKIKVPQHFFNYLTKASVRFPETLDAKTYKALDDDNRAKPWLRKQIGGVGGTHIQYQAHENAPTADNYLKDVYYQTHIEGQPISLLFLASPVLNGVASVKPISFNAQFLAPTQSMPFRFGGAVSHVRLSNSTKSQLLGIAQILTQQFDLKGLNSLDVILHDNEIFVLEVNPRLSATMDLQMNQAALIKQHMMACGIAVKDLPAQKTSCSEAISDDFSQQYAIAQVVLYADNPLAIPRDFIWPSWVKDTLYAENNSRQKTHLFKQDAPICTVYAQAKSATLARKTAMQRAKFLKKQLTVFQ